MAIRSRGLDTTDRKVLAANDIDNTDGLVAWATGKRSFITDPAGTEFVKGVGDMDLEPREISASGPALNDQDKADLEAGRAIITFKHDAVLDDRDRELIASGKAKQLPQPIRQDRAGSLSNDELQNIATGKATFVPASAAAPSEFVKGADGRLQIPRERLHEALDRGITSLDDVASGRVNVVG